MISLAPFNTPSTQSPSRLPLKPCRNSHPSQYLRPADRPLASRNFVELLAACDAIDTRRCATPNSHRYTHTHTQTQPHTPWPDIRVCPVCEHTHAAAPRRLRGVLLPRAPASVCARGVSRPRTGRRATEPRGDPGRVRRLGRHPKHKMEEHYNMIGRCVYPAFGWHRGEKGSEEGSQSWPWWRPSMPAIGTPTWHRRSTAMPGEEPPAAVAVAVAVAEGFREPPHPAVNAIAPGPRCRVPACPPASLSRSRDSRPPSPQSQEQEQYLAHASPAQRSGGFPYQIREYLSGLVRMLAPRLSTVPLFIRRADPACL